MQRPLNACDVGLVDENIEMTQEYKTKKKPEDRRKSVVLCSKNNRRKPKPTATDGEKPRPVVRPTTVVQGSNGGSISSHGSYPHDKLGKNKVCNVELKSNSPITLNLITIQLGGKELMNKNCNDSYL